MTLKIVQGIREGHPYPTAIHTPVFTHSWIGHYRLKKYSYQFGLDLSFLVLADSFDITLGISSEEDWIVTKSSELHLRTQRN